MTFDLLPTSYVFEVGHRVRIAVAGADASHFAVVPSGPSTLFMHRTRLHPSRIDLPVIGASPRQRFSAIQSPVKRCIAPISSPAWPAM